MPDVSSPPLPTTGTPLWRWLIWLAYASSWTVALLTTQPATLADTVLPPAAHFPAAKTLHVVAYAVLAGLSGWLRVAPRYRIWLLLLLSAHAFATEFGQQFVPHRGPSLRDVLLDHAGLALGVALTWAWWRAPARET